MSQPERAESGKIALEDLLRVKRAERPSPEFWVHFEQELRAKQLAAAIEKRPWWVGLRLPQLARVLGRYQLPLGASAVLLLGVVAVREFRPAVSVPLAPIATADAPSIAVPAAPARDEAGPSPVLATVDPLRTTSVMEIAESGATLDPRPVATAGSAEPAGPNGSPAHLGPGALMAMIPWAPQGVSFDPPTTPVLGELSEVRFANVVAPARYADFTTHRMELEPLRIPVRSAAPVVVAAATAPAKPVAAPVVSRREIRRDRLLSTLVVADNTVDVERSRFAQVREIVADTLDEDRLYDSVRRLGMGGDRVTLKF